MNRRVLGLIGVSLLWACSHGNDAAAPQSTQQGIFAVRQAAAPAGATRVTLSALPSAGPIVTVMGQLTYDVGRLRMQNCEINPQIGAGTGAGKSLTFAEPNPGMVRAVVAGGLEQLPVSSDVFSCTFTVLSGGATNIHAEGDVSDTTFVDRPFAADATVTGNVAQ